MVFHQHAVERSRAQLAKGTPWIAGQNADTGQWSLRVGNHARLDKRHGCALWMEKVSGEQQNVENREPAANRGFPVAARIPGKTEARLEIAGRGVGEKRGNPGAARLSSYRGKGRFRGPALGQWGVEGGEGGQLAVHLIRHGCHLVA